MTISSLPLANQLSVQAKVAVVVAFLCVWAPACTDRDNGVLIDNAWIRSPPPGAQMLAGYCVISNLSDAAIKITSVSSDEFAAVSLHETRQINGRATMRPVKELRVAAGETVSLEPGGLHLMLMNPVSPEVADHPVTVSFHLDTGARLSRSFVFSSTRID